MTRPGAQTLILITALVAALQASASERGSLLVSGRASASQGVQVSVQRCELDSQGRIARFGCSEMAEGELNHPIALAPGHYRALFSGTVSALAEVRAGSETVLELARLSVPSSAAGGGARFFHDLNDARERQWLVGDVLAQAENAELFEKDCDPGLPGLFSEATTRAACDAIRSGKLGALAGKLVRFHPDASWSTLAYSGTLIFDHGIGAHFENQGRIWVNETLEPASEVSVFPGVYGVELRGSDGKLTERYGILAQAPNG